MFIRLHRCSTMKVSLQGFIVVIALTISTDIVKADVETSDEMFQLKALEAHNAKRALHGSQPLVLNSTLNKQAQNYANTMALGDYSPSYTAIYGNNIFWSGPVPMTIGADDPVDKWYSTMQKYDFNNPGQSPEAVDFTHVVWKRSTGLGVGVARCPRGTNYVIAIYDPKPVGMFPEDYEENVPRPL